MADSDILSAMLQSGKCIKCASTEIVRRARVIDNVQGFDQDQRLRVDADPDALLLKDPSHSIVEACVCGNCGYAELYASDPAALLAAWRRSQESSKG
jgi:predicted nucleic-acid-binding Zn-ribbon protein